MSRKPEVWRGAVPHYKNIDGQFISTSGVIPFNCTVIEDGAVMPLDAATERLVGFVRRALKEKQLAFAWQKEGEGMLAAFDAARKGKQ